MQFHDLSRLEREFESRSREEEITNSQYQRTSWLQAYSSVFERADRIVTGVPVRVILAPKGPAPGWTDGQDIYLNQQMMEAKLQHGATTELIMGIKGVNYHEVAHCIFMPRMGSKFVKTIQDRHRLGRYRGNYWHTWNILEDMRDETLFAGSFGTSVVYFTNTVLQWILDDPQNAQVAWPLLNGRKFLPPVLRTELRKTFGALTDIDIDALDEIADAYLKTVFPRDQKLGLNLVDEYHHLMIKAGDDLGGDIEETTSGGHGDGAPKSDKRRGRPADSATQEAAQENLEAAEEEWESAAWEDDVEEDLDDRDSGPVNVGSPSDAESDEEPEGDSTGSGSGDGSTSEDSAEQQKPPTGGDSQPGHGDDRDLEAVIPDIEQIADKLQQDLMQNEQILEDIQDTQDAAKVEVDNQDYKVEGKRQKHNLMPVGDADIALKNVMVRHLQEILTEMAPTTIRRQPSGFLDIRKAMNAPHGDTNVFRRFDEGHEGEATTEVVILLDQSYSMDWLIDKASRVLWSLKSALDKVDIKTTVFGFSDTHHLLLRPEDKMLDQYRSFGIIGGTEPASGLYEAKKILERSSSDNKVVIIITDGGWWDRPDFVLTRNALQKMGATLGIIKLDTNRIKHVDPDKPITPWFEQENGDHGFDVMHTVNPNNLEQAGLAIEKIVGEVMTRAVGLF